MEKSFCMLSSDWLVDLSFLFIWHSHPIQYVHWPKEHNMFVDAWNQQRQVEYQYSVGWVRLRVLLHSSIVILFLVFMIQHPKCRNSNTDVQIIYFIARLPFLLAGFPITGSLNDEAYFSVPVDLTYANSEKEAIVHNLLTRPRPGCARWIQLNVFLMIYSWQPVP